jgi:hypothetical protein
LLRWEAKQAELKGSTPDEQTVQELLQQCRDFIEQVNQTLKEEMEEWVHEFRQNLAEIDKVAKAQAQMIDKGAINVMVSNADQCKDGWYISIDDVAPMKRKGKTAAFGGLAAESHILSVSGTINGKEMHAESAVIVTQGRTEQVSLTLA